MKDRKSKIFFSELKNYMKSEEITNNKKFLSLLELIQHINHFNVKSKTKLKRFFSIKKKYFSKTYLYFSSIFSENKLDDRGKSIFTLRIKKYMYRVIRDSKIKDIIFPIVFFLFNFFLFWYIFEIVLDLNYLELIHTRLWIIALVIGSYIVLNILSFMILSERQLTRFWDKTRRFFREIERTIGLILLFLYIAVFLFILFSIETPILLTNDIYLSLIILPPILVSIPVLIDGLNSYKMLFYDDFLLYLNYNIVLLKFNHGYIFDLPYFFKRLLISLNNSLRYYFDFEIINQEELENQFIHNILLKDHKKKKFFGAKLESLLYIDKEINLKYKYNLSSGTILEVLTKFGDILQSTQFSPLKFKVINIWYKISKMKIFRLRKIILLIGAIISIIIPIFSFFGL
jgi:hypothetical protein